MGRLHKFVFTGGPCAGKTTAISRVRSYLENRGFIIITVPEAATVAMSNGIIVYPDNFENFQLAITSLQINNEKIFSEFAESVALKNEKDVVVLFDRAIIDGSAYCSDEEFQKMLCRLSRPKKEEILSYYDAVLYLVSAAEGAEDFYDKIGVRYETAAEARDTDKRTLDAWKKHKNLIIFDNVLKSFETKMREVVDAVCTLLKIPLTAKLPRKYILADPSNIKFPSNVLVKSVTIEKTFIKNSGQKEDNEMYTFLRHSKSNDVSRYTLKKVKFEKKQRIERKENIAFRQYESLKLFSDGDRNVIHQKRKLFSVGNTYYEINCYDNSVLKETLLNVYSPEESGEENVLPKFLKIEREVTNDYHYSSHYLAKKNKKQNYEFGKLFDGGEDINFGIK